MSTTVKVSLVGAAAAVTAAAVIGVVNSNDDNPADHKIYNSPEACMADGRSVAECKEGWDAAVKRHIETAPRYGTLQECEAVFGKCTDGTEQPQAATTAPSTPSTSSTGTTTTHHGGGSFWPYIIGYHMGQNSSHYNSVPAYVGRNNAPVTSTGSSFKTATNGSTTSYRTDPYVAHPAPQTQPKTHPDAPSQYGRATTPPSTTTTSQRGGFGSTPSPSGSVGG